MDPTMLAPAFIVGCARSGTSILGETIAAHPQVAYLYEVSPLWTELFPDRDDDRLEPTDAGDAEAARRLRGAFARELAESGKRLLVEKNPKHALRVAFLDALFPACKVLHIIRDGRDTVASLMFRNRRREWGHLKVPGWRELLERFPEANHVRCAHQWREAVRCARAEGHALGAGRYLEVRYERLVAEPVAAIADVLAFLGLEPSAEVDAAATRIQDATAGSYHARKQVRHFVDNHARRVGRHRENLTAEQLREVEAVCGDLLVELGYE